MDGGGGKAAHRQAFTLADTLITLGIIGIVAAMTLPVLTKKYQYHILENQFKKQYSVLQQALLNMQAADGQIINNNNYPPQTFAPKFFKQLKIILNCGSDGCEEMDFDSANGNYADLTSKVYKTFNKSRFAGSLLFDDGQAMTSDAAFIMINHSVAAQKITISIDINGYHKAPNIWGYDLFTFEILNDSGKLVPAGTKGTYYEQSRNTRCSLSSSDKMNGITCSYHALSDKNYWKNLR